ncbi:MAG: DUF1801 domain-containing protein [Cyclobacteriaceae bacterium]|nr:DUF1801 domain-containing protein [Cyclobacteriaceae bacterium]
MNSEVNDFLDNANHPLRAEIEALRKIILAAQPQLTENIKWNGPNYCNSGEDRITMRIYPPKQVQLVFHRGAKKMEQPKERLVNDASGLLQWKENDRAVAGFKSLEEIKKAENNLKDIVKKWIEVTR